MTISIIKSSVYPVTGSEETNQRFGTAFVIAYHENATYLVTCAHVIRDVGGIQNVRVASHQAMVIACGNEEGPDDLAILRVDALSNVLPLRLTSLVESGCPFIAPGFQLFGKNYLLRQIEGTLGNQVSLTSRELSDRIPAWDLRLTNESQLRPGYSGAPVIDKATEGVFAIISHKLGNGEQGLAISTEVISSIWPEVANFVSKPHIIKSQTPNVENVSNAKVFISYAREDKEIAQKLYSDLKSAGVIPWLDTENILPGQKWKLAIRRALRESAYVLVLLSSNSISKRGFAQKELKMALDVLDEFPSDRIFIIPVLIEKCDLIEERLQEIQWVELSSYEEGFSKIMRTICSF